MDCRGKGLLDWWLCPAERWAEGVGVREAGLDPPARWGALLVKDRMIISDGYNGTPSGFENICEDENGITKPYVLHAEANAISKVAQSGNSSKDATLYVTASPCLECAKLIIQAGIKRVVYRDPYRLTDGIDLLRRAGIEVEQVD